MNWWSELGYVEAVLWTLLSDDGFSSRMLGLFISSPALRCHGEVEDRRYVHGPITTPYVRSKRGGL